MKTEPRTRRDFLRSVARVFCLGGAGAMTGWLSARGQVSMAAREECVSQGVCRGCDRLSACGLPAALSARPHLLGRD